MTNGLKTTAWKDGLKSFPVTFLLKAYSYLCLRTMSIKNYKMYFNLIRKTLQALRSALVFSEILPTKTCHA